LVTLGIVNPPSPCRASVDVEDWPNARPSPNYPLTPFALRTLNVGHNCRLGIPTLVDVRLELLISDRDQAMMRT